LVAETAGFLVFGEDFIAGRLNAKDTGIAVGAYRARNEWKHHSAFRALAKYLCQNFREIVEISSNVGWIVRHSIFPH
jgi:hypothetical protein